MICTVFLLKTWYRSHIGRVNIYVILGSQNNLALCCIAWHIGAINIWLIKKNLWEPRLLVGRR